MVLDLLPNNLLRMLCICQPKKDPAANADPKTNKPFVKLDGESMHRLCELQASKVKSNNSFLFFPLM